MAYVPVTQRPYESQTKVAFNLTRGSLSASAAGRSSAYRFSFCSGGLWENSVAAMCMMLVMLPFFMLAMYEKHGQPLEKIVGNIIKVAVIRPKERPYQTKNFYARSGTAGKTRQGGV